jgi:S1-C subfamily serine protease
MISKNKIAGLFILTLMLNSCVTVFLPNKQKVTILTNSDDAKIYLDNEKFGEGKTATKKIKKGKVYDVAINYGDDYMQYNDVLYPNLKKSAGYYVLQGVNVPFCFVLYGFYAVWLDSQIAKSHPFPKEVKFESPLKKVLKRSEDSKYVNLTNISLDINNVDKDFVSHFATIEKRDKGDLEATKLRAEKMTKDKQLKAEIREKKKKKKGKKAELLVEEQKDFKFHDVVFTDELLQMLYKGGYMDTINDVFSDNNNSLFIQGKMDGVDMFSINPINAHSWTTYGKITQTRTSLIWYIKNSYGEVLDSVVDLAFSEKFKYDYENGSVKKTVGNSIALSFYNLIEGDLFKKYAKIETDFNPNLKVTTLKNPTAIVREKVDAAEATVIIKTSKGHGSGFLITNDGYIVTNYHVIASKNPSKTHDITIIDSDGNEMDCSVVKVNKFQDIALLKVDKQFKKAFVCSNQKTFRKMEDVFTIGAPKSISLGQSISSGIISNERKINNNNLIQLNMSINAGNSGGPVFDSKGNLHGIVVSKLVGRNTEGVGFAVPSYLLQEYLNIKF